MKQPVNLVTAKFSCNFARKEVMDKTKKAGRYHRIYLQLTDLLTKTSDPLARMATINALLYHKMDGFFWTGFYLLHDGDLIVGPYQGPVGLPGPGEGYRRLLGGHQQAGGGDRSGCGKIPWTYCL